MGRVLAVDPGTVRVGLAISDTLRLTAQPLEVVPAAEAIDRVQVIVAEMDVDEIVVGLPTTESGGESVSTRKARDLADALAAATGLPVIPVDERYTTRLAESTMISGGARRRTRRESLDKVAAAVLLRSYLDSPGSRQ